MMVLVDTDDNKIGLMEKMETHEKGLLHRAFSGFVFDDEGRLLIQQRAQGKYHNPNIWANTVCSHPFDGERIEDGVKRRLMQELGFAEDFTLVTKFIYKSTFENGLTEHELDNVLIAQYSGSNIQPDATEVQSFRWITRDELETEIATNPDNFSFWLKEILRLGLINEFFPR